jgi:hypothetical protein
MNQPQQRLPQNPLDSRQRVHLEWMFENQPQLLRALHHQNQLRQHLDQKHQQALRLVDRLKEERGLSEDEAFEVAINSVLAPPDGPAFQDNPPSPLPLKEQQAVYQSLEA